MSKPDPSQPTRPPKSGKDGAPSKPKVGLPLIILGLVLFALVATMLRKANEVQKPIPPGLEVTCPDQTHIVVKGCDKQQVGQFAAEVRALRKPEPYKGKGIRYEGEAIRRKQGKVMAK